MTNQEENLLLYGSPEPPPERVTLRAGPLTMEYEAGGLRNILYAGRPIVQRIYFALRDRDWGTVPNALSDERIDAGPDHFRVTYTAENRRGEIAFRWQAHIDGAADGSVRFAFEGEALSSYEHSRTGFCLLHPIEPCAGQPATVWRASSPPSPGSSEARTGGEGGLFPTLIAPAEIPPFLDMTAMQYSAAPGADLRIDFAGDLFEMEDQRNWTDASFKTFCTPLRLPIPRRIQPGERITQAITLSLIGAPAAEPAELAAPAGAAAPVELTLTGSPAGRLPALGLTAGDAALGASETARLAAIGLSFLRVDLHLGRTSARPDPLAALRRAAALAAAAGLPLEIALRLSADPADLADLAAAVGQLRPPVIRWTVFPPGALVGDPAAVAAARRALAGVTPGAAFGVASDGDFFDLNAARPGPAWLDFLGFAANPQIHAFDNDSIMETPETQAAAVQTARAFSGLPVVVGPVTLKQRFNPVALGPAPTPAPGELPAAVDPRQPSLFAAAWTLAGLAALTAAQAEAVTYYEASGWQGVQLGPGGAPLPEKFHAAADTVFPVYHVLRAAAEFTAAEALAVACTQPAAVAALALTHAGRLRLLLANRAARPLALRLAGLPAAVDLALLDAAAAPTAATQPDFLVRPSDRPLATRAGVLELTLPAYAVVRLDGQGFSASPGA